MKTDRSDDFVIDFLVNLEGIVDRVGNGILVGVGLQDVVGLKKAVEEWGRSGNLLSIRLSAKHSMRSEHLCEIRLSAKCSMRGQDFDEPNATIVDGGGPGAHRQV